MIRKLLCWLGLLPHEWEDRKLCSVYVEGNSVGGVTKCENFQEHFYQQCKHCGRVR